jgi:ribosome biogenesis protein BRX1
MAAVYKSLSKSSGSKAEKDTDGKVVERKNKQRVLILSSRGVTYRYGLDQLRRREKTSG